MNDRTKTGLAAIFSVVALLAMSGACLRDALRGGDNKPMASTDQATGPIQAGGDVWAFNFSRTEQAAGGTAALTFLGWLASAVRAWRNGKDRDALILAVEQREKFPSAKPVKTYIRDYVKSPSLNARVKKLTGAGKK